jgi:hypothetical protein
MTIQSRGNLKNGNPDIYLRHETSIENKRNAEIESTVMMEHRKYSNSNEGMKKRYT